MNGKIVDYVILTANNTDELTSMVRGKIKEGWQPWGNAGCNTLHAGTADETGEYWREMVKYAKS